MAAEKMTWHRDGHKIRLQINKAELEIVDIECPDSESNGDCYMEDYGCVVTWFLNRYGMECNAGKCPASSELEVCWTFIGDKKNIEAAQVWFMPLTDDFFMAWLTSTKNQ